MIDTKYLDKEFQHKALKWWRGLSLNEMRRFEEVYKALRVAGVTSIHDIAKIYDNEYELSGKKRYVIQGIVSGHGFCDTKYQSDNLKDIVRMLKGYRNTDKFWMPPTNTMEKRITMSRIWDREEGKVI